MDDQILLFGSTSAFRISYENNTCYDGETGEGDNLLKFRNVSEPKDLLVTVRFESVEPWSPDRHHVEDRKQDLPEPEFQYLT